MFAIQTNRILLERLQTLNNREVSGVNVQYERTNGCTLRRPQDALWSRAN
jgi:hypothetical protein